jgi:uncharacterized membrane protein YbhN (UPF0104 family)
LRFLRRSSGDFPSTTYTGGLPHPVKQDRTARVWNILKVLLAFALVGFVLSQTDLAQLFDLRKRMDATWLTIVILSYFLLTLLKACQYYFLVGRRVGYPQVLNIVIVQNSVSNFIATGAGIASYLTLFRVEQGVKLSRAAVAFLLTKVGDLISIWLFLMAASWAVWPHVGALHSLVSILLTGIGIVIALFFMMVFLRQEFVSLLRTLLDGLRISRLTFVSKGVDFLENIAEQEQSFVFQTIGLSLLFSLLYMSVTLLWLYASLRAFSFRIDILPTVFVNMLIQLVSYLPVQVFGGLGVNETTMLYLYGYFQASQTELAAVLIGGRLLFYLTNLAVLLYLPLHTLFFIRSSKTR